MSAETKPANPPAFPCETPNEIFSGVTMRDWFAGKALTGLMNEGWQLDGNPFDAHKAERTAKIAYEFANAMLKEREK